MARALAERHRVKRQHEAIESLAGFVRYAWPIVEPGVELVWNWHLDAICGELEKITRGENDRLVICIPPGMMKSLLVSVFWPAWWWLRDPGLRSLWLAGDDTLAARDSRRCKMIVQSDEYLELVALTPKPWTLALDQRQKINFATTEAGFRQCLGIRSAVTGKRGRGLGIDDPVDAKTVVQLSSDRQAEVMAEVVATFDQVLKSRVNDRRPGRHHYVIIAQRLHPDDLPGVLIRKGWPSVVLPMEYDPDLDQRFEGDSRTEPGELLFPVMFPAEVVDSMKTEMGSQYSAQCGQDPAPPTGTMFEAALAACPRYMEPPRAVAGGKGVVMSMDPKGGSKTKGSSYDVIQAWAHRGAERWLLWQDRARWDFVEEEARMKSAAQSWPTQRRFIVEDKANGKSLVRVLKKSIPYVTEFKVSGRGDKEQKAKPLKVAMQEGQVHLPHRDNPHIEWVECEFGEIAVLLRAAEAAGEEWPSKVKPTAGKCSVPWVVVFEAEVLKFPKGRHDDQVDAAAMAVTWIGENQTWDAPITPIADPDSRGAHLDFGAPDDNMEDAGRWS